MSTRRTYVVVGVVCNLLLVLNSPLSQDGRLNAGLVAMLLLELGEGRIQGLRFASRQTLQGKLAAGQDQCCDVVSCDPKRSKRESGAYLVDNSCAVKLFQSRLHPRERGEHTLRTLDLLLLVSEELERHLEDLPSLVCERAAKGELV